MVFRNPEEYLYLHYLSQWERTAPVNGSWGQLDDNPAENTQTARMVRVLQMLTGLHDPPLRKLEKHTQRRDGRSFVGFLYAIGKDNFDKEARIYQVAADTVKKCHSSDPMEKAASTKLLSDMYADKDAIKEIFGGVERFSILRRICNTALSSQEAENRREQISPPPGEIKVDTTPSAPVPPPKGQEARSSSPSAPPNEGDRYWVYLGTFRDGKWLTKYLDIPDNFDPAKFSVDKDAKKGKYKVREQTGALNVRFGSFSPTGEFPPTTSPLQPSKEVQIRSIAQWFDSGNWWATIEKP
jgi:hypothetical protein